MQDKRIQDVALNREPVTLPPDATVQYAGAIMRERRVGAIVVVEGGGRVVGIFTGRDAICRVLAERRDPARLHLADAMTAQPATLPPEAGVLDALRLMQDGGFRHVPIVDAEGRLLGVVSRGDFRATQHARLAEETEFFEHLR